MSLEQYYGTGRRKTSTARVYLRPKKSKVASFVVNRTDLHSYFNRDSLKLMMRQPLEELGLQDNFDILVNVKGGGKAGQAGAIRLGIARALLEYDQNLRPDLKKRGMLTRDARMVERKKYGQPGARKRFQFSKR